MSSVRAATTRGNQAAFYTVRTMTGRQVLTHPNITAALHPKVNRITMQKRHPNEIQELNTTQVYEAGPKADLSPSPLLSFPV